MLQDSYRSPSQNCLLGFIRRAARLDVATTNRHLQPIKQCEIKTTSKFHFFIVKLKSQSMGATIYIYIYIYTHTHTLTHIHTYIHTYVCVCEYKRRKPIKSIKYMIRKMRVKQCRR